MSLLSKERKHAQLQEVVDNTTLTPSPSPVGNNLIISHDQSDHIQDHHNLHNYNSSNNSVISFESAAGHNNNNFLHNHVGAATIGGGGSYLRFDNHHHDHHQQQQQQHEISPNSNGYHDDHYPFWEDNNNNTSLISNEGYNQPYNQKTRAKRNLARDFNYNQLSGSGMKNNNINNNASTQVVVGEKDQQFGIWPSSSSQSSSEVDMAAIEAIQDVIATQQSPIVGNIGSTSLKRRLMGENTQAMKKQCNDSGNGSGVVLINSKSKTKSIANPSLSKDPQSIAAKNRRERISERLKILQEMVPNGSKVDLVTMLEKAISYVKFLQLQVKVLATDEFWPTAGGKAPNLSQVREAIDAILASHRDRSSSSK